LKNDIVTKREILNAIYLWHYLLFRSAKATWLLRS